MDFSRDESLLRFGWYVHEQGYCWEPGELKLREVPGGFETLPDPVGPFGEASLPVDDAALLWVGGLVYQTVEEKRHPLVLRAKSPLVEDELAGYELFEREPADKSRLTLFREFCKLKPTEASIKNFADQHGYLGVGGICESTGTGESFYGEPFELWEEEVWRLSRAFDMWWTARRAAEGITEKLNILMSQINLKDLVIQWPRKAGQPLHQLIPTQLLRTIEQDPAEITGDDLEDPDKIIRCAFYCVHREIEEALLRYTIDPYPRWRLAKETRHSHTDFVFRPRTLIGALWLQFTLAVAENPEIRICAREGCSEPILIGGRYGANRKRRFCTDACKSTDRRQREKEKQPRAKP